MLLRAALELKIDAVGAGVGNPDDSDISSVLGDIEGPLSIALGRLEAVGSHSRTERK